MLGDSIRFDVLSKIDCGCLLRLGQCLVLSPNSFTVGIRALSGQRELLSIEHTDEYTLSRT